MFLRQFQYLVALEQEGHFGRAAERCNVSQPTLSSGIKHLEEELGVPIILRRRRFEGFTAEGRRVIQWSKRILADRDAMVAELGVMRGNFHGTLRIAAMPNAMPVTAILNRLMLERYPGAKVDVQFVGLDDMTQGLGNFEYDVGITYLQDTPPDRLCSLALYEDPLDLLVPDREWLPGRDEMTWAEAADMPLCLLAPSTHERQLINAAFAHAGAQPQPRVESNAMISLVSQAMDGGLATVVPRHFMRAIGAPDNARLVRLREPDIAHRVGLVWLDSDPPMPLTEAVVDAMTEAVADGTLAAAFPCSWPEPA